MIAESDAPKVGSFHCVWIGPGFERTAEIIAVNLYDEEVLLRWQYPNLPDEWYPIRRL